MKTPTIRGLSSEDAQDRRQLRRDIRSPLQRLLVKIGRANSLVVGLGVITLLELIAPEWALVWVFSCLLLLLARYKEISSALPLKLPLSAQRKDPHDPGPGRQFWKPAAGTTLVGHNVENGQEMWISDKDLLTHTLLLGTTGSGKTETLLSLGFNALASGSGLFYIDPKAAPNLAAQVWRMARTLGRDDDFRVLNFGAPRRHMEPWQRLSNTNNPFSEGTAEALTQILASLMPPSDGHNNIFADKAMNLIAALIQVLVDLRDKRQIILTAAKIRESLVIEVCLQLMNSPHISPTSRAALISALHSCNWSEARPLDQQRDFYEQFGYAQSYFGRALSNLTDAYGHIYGVETGEVDFRDVVMNRRILVALLPSLEKSPLELASLGKIVLSSLKSAAAVGLGLEIEGEAKNILGSLPIHFFGSGPFMAIVDEYAAIVTPGFEMILTQGRGLGVSTVIASQDYAGLVEADRKGAQQIVANTNLKIFMKLAEPEKTWTLIRNLSGDDPILRASGFNIKSEEPTFGWRDNLDAVVEMATVSDLRDLMEQTEGEAHCVHQGKMIRARLFYANIQIPDSPLRVPRLVRLETYKSPQNPLERSDGQINPEELARDGQYEPATREDPATDVDDYEDDYAGDARD
ncbi:MAG: type IV secretion system DNA-binding domain-containing protein [Deltaproteobacteria bacterium]|jgi:intracellular multiplication protein IcmO|nr:type IV secretion system DNA-binding domain-containing protein [Deltaproteobacteria bacterium]